MREADECADGYGSSQGCCRTYIEETPATSSHKTRKRCPPGALELLVYVVLHPHVLVGVRLPQLNHMPGKAIRGGLCGADLGLELVLNSECKHNPNGAKLDSVSGARLHGVFDSSHVHEQRTSRSLSLKENISSMLPNRR